MNENWVTVTGWHEYEVSDLGRVRSLDRIVAHSRSGKFLKSGRVLSPIKDKDGYLYVNLCVGKVRKHGKIHRMVAQHFLQASSLPEVNHKDFDKSNNAATNLEWVTGKENHAHALAGGRRSARTNPNCAKKLTIESVNAIHEARRDGKSFLSIGLMFDISRSSARRVVVGESWSV
jgi:hypothetical protein